ncbi:MAG: DUF1428 domain-containing protein [Sandaracinobacteroides sp.]
MTYVDGYVVAVPIANKEAYLKHAEQSVPLFKEFGALTLVESWGDDVPDGKLTSLPMAVQKKPDEVVVFSWVTWPDKATRDAGWKAMMDDPRMKAMGDMPFDGKRMIFGGFEVILQA